MEIEEKKIRYGVGIDTGGTFTDAVLVDLDSLDVLKTVKRPTTRYNVGRGVLEALEGVLAGVERDAVEKIAFSTTLATNAVAEGRGAKVGLFVLGPVKSLDLPVVSVRHLDGGHDHLGNELRPLEIERVVEAVEEMKGHVDAYAVAAGMSFVNPSHELVAAKAIELLDPKPVFCSHLVSERSGIGERAATAVLHARLMPVLMDFVGRVKGLSAEKPVAADMKIIRGDASAVDLEQAVSRAAQTAASGPAATAWYGAKSVAEEKALIVDVGGTTTDITLVENGRPAVSTGGCLIDRWPTHIDAVQTHTVGIGGDSLVIVDRSGRLTIGPRRVQPIAMSDGVAAPESWMGVENRGRYFLRPQADADDDESRDPVVDLLREGGAAFGELATLAGMSELSLDRRIEELVFQKKAVEIGFTPTDALHALGRLDIGDPAKSVAAAGVLAKLRNQSAESFCEDVVRLAQKKIADAIVAFLYAKETGRETARFPFPEEKLSLFSVSFKIDVPVVGIGAAADRLLPEVAKRLGTRIVFPPFHEVGNALGAIMIASNEGR